MDAREDRPSDPEPPGYAFGAFQIDLPAYCLREDGQALALPPRAFDTLVYLVRHRNRVVTKEELLKGVWPDTFVQEDSLTQCISTLRHALRDSANSPVFIVTVSRRGYRFIGSVRELVEEHAPEAAAAGAAGTPARTIEPPAAPPADSSVPVAPRPDRRDIRYAGALRWVGIAAATLLVVAALTATTYRGFSRQAAVPQSLLQFTQELPPGATLITSGSLSPDGKYLAFSARDEATATDRMWLRSLDSPIPHQLPGTEGATTPFWSPDSSSFAFFDGGKLVRTRVGDERLHTIWADTEQSANPGPRSNGGSWSTAGVILFAEFRSGLFSTPVSGGAVSSVTSLDAAAHETAHRWPQFLPDATHFLYYIDAVEPSHAGTYIGSLGSNEKVRLIEGPAVYAPSGHLLYFRNRMLVAQPFDATRRRLAGTARVVAENITAANTYLGMNVSVAANDLLLLRGALKPERLQWFSHSGERLGAIDPSLAFHNPSFSRTGETLIAAVNNGDLRGIWAIDLKGGAATRLSQEGWRPLLSPDERELVFSSDRAAGVADFYLRPMSGREREETVLLQTPQNKLLCDWSRDGRYIIYTALDNRTKADIWLLPLFGDRQPTPYLKTPFNELQAKLSPDGHWLAYSSDESGRWEVYLQSFPVSGNKRTMSVGGGSEPQWSPDGRALYYLSPEGSVTMVDVDAKSSSRPHALFRVPLAGFDMYSGQWAIAPDGQRFLIATAEGHNLAEPISILVNWSTLLKQ